MPVKRLVYPGSTLLRRVFCLMMAGIFVVALFGPVSPGAGTAGTVNRPLPATDNGRTEEIVEGVTSVPAAVYDLSFQPYVELVHLGLTKVDGWGEILPGLARSWESADAYRWVFHLDPRARWHDGRPVAAEDVASAIRRVQDPSAQSPWQAYWSQVQIVLAEGGTIVLDLPRPDSSFPYDARMPILPADDPSGRIGAGPFRLVSWDPEREIRLEAVPDHWLTNPERPRLRRYVLRAVGSEEAAAAELERGRVHLFAPDWRAAVKSVPTADGHRFGVTRWPAPAYSFVIMNLGGASGRLDDLRARQALTLAIDRRRIAKLFGGYAADGPYIPGTSYGSAALEDATALAADAVSAATSSPSHGLERIRELLEQAGWPSGQVIQFVYESGRPDRARLAELVADDLAAVGIKLQSRAIPDEEMFKRLRTGDFEAALFGWEVGPHPDLHALFHTHGSTNYSRFSDSRADELIEEARVTVDPMFRRDILDRLRRLLAAESRYLFLHTPGAFLWHSPRLRGHAPGPFSIRHNASGWTVHH